MSGFGLTVSIVSLLVATVALWMVWRTEWIFEKLKVGFLALPAYFDEFIYSRLKLIPALLGTKLSDLTIRVETDLVMVAAGGLMGIRTGVSLLIGAVVNYFVLAPVLIKNGIITASAKGTIGFREITMWSLWGGVAMMTTSSLFAFFAKPKLQ